MTCWRWLLAPIVLPVLVCAALVAAPATPASACTVAAVDYYRGSKFETAPIVVTGTVKNALGRSFDLVVEETLRGNVPGGVLRLSNLYPRADSRDGTGANCEIKDIAGRFKEGTRLIVLAPANGKPETAIPYRQYAAAIIEGDAVTYGIPNSRPIPLADIRAAIAERGAVPASVVEEVASPALPETPVAPVAGGGSAGVRAVGNGGGPGETFALIAVAFATVVLAAVTTLAIRPRHWRRPL